MFRLGSRRACSAKSSVSTRPLPERTPSFTSNRRRSSRNRPRDQPVGADRPGDSLPECDLVEPALFRAGPGPVFHQVVFVAAAQQREQRARGKPARPGDADLEVDQTGLASLIHEDVFALVQVDVNDFPFMHRPEQGAERRIKRFVHVLAVAERVALNVISCHGVAE